MQLEEKEAGESLLLKWIGVSLKRPTENNGTAGDDRPYQQYRWRAYCVFAVLVI